MAEINRIGSPMDLCDEGFDEAPAVIEKRKRNLQNKQATKSPFLIGTIEDVNHKIGKLEQRLQNYTQLIVESRASDYPDSLDPETTSSFGRQRYQDREKENREVCKFAGIYTVKSTFLPNLSNRVKHISKISMHPPKEKPLVKKDKDSSKPKFVELHQYPGYDPLELTPLPGLAATEVLQIVVDASVNLNKKLQYKPEFQRMFFSPMSQAVLQDIFWYLFLEKFQPSQASQQELFNRTAHNYVKLIFFSKNTHFRDTFLKDYPKLMSQGVYASFCHCFPDSFRQFGETFKNDLVFLVYGWIAGLRPSPRCWLDWNLSKLEPANIHMREEMMNMTKKRQSQAMSFNFDYLDTLTSTNPSQYPSSLSLDISKSSTGSNWERRGKPYKKTRKFSKRSHSPETLSQDSNVIDAVANAQARSKKTSLTSAGSLETQSCGNGGEIHRTWKSKNGMGDGLSPIREMATEEGATMSQDDKKMSQYSVPISTNNSRNEMESHPACKGPDFTRTTFNLHGRSPLVAHFLRMRNITNDMNIVTRVQRTQLDNLPPLDAPTYKDVIRQSSKTVGIIEKQFQLMYSRNQKEMSVFCSQQAAEMAEHRKRENLLLSKKPEVKRLSELIILEQKKGLDSISAGASIAVEAALMSQEL